MMDDIKSMFRKGHKVFREYLTLSLWFVVTIQVLISVILPAFEKALGETKDVPPWAIIFVLIIHAALGLYVSYALIRMRQFIQAVSIDEIEQKVNHNIAQLNLQLNEFKVRTDEMTDTIRIGNIETATLSHQLAAILGSLSVLKILLEEQVESVSLEDVDKLMTPLILSRAESFNFVLDDLYNFVIYIIHKSDRKLHVYYRDCDNRIERHDRIWGKGEGHVGIAYAQKKTISDDDSGSLTRTFVRDQLDSDEKFYKSFISTPILAKDTSADPIGILVVTSSRKGHINNKYELLVETFGHILSTYFINRKVESL